MAFSQESFDLDKLLKEKPTKLVIDFTGTLTPDQAQALENKLVAFDDSTSTRIAVVIVPSMQGRDIADFNIDLGGHGVLAAKKIIMALFY
ncbi:MAG: TPM domain-containing protein [Chitinophagaceae bacterium]|nr:TPM domain-containing protein [Chitinophagaceae bacterium]